MNSLARNLLPENADYTSGERIPYTWTKGGVLGKERTRWSLRRALKARLSYLRNLGHRIPLLLRLRPLLLGGTRMGCFLKFDECRIWYVGPLSVSRLVGHVLSRQNDVLIWHEMKSAWRAQYCHGHDGLGARHYRDVLDYDGPPLPDNNVGRKLLWLSGMPKEQRLSMGRLWDARNAGTFTPHADTGVAELAKPVLVATTPSGRKRKRRVRRKTKSNVSTMPVAPQEQAGPALGKGGPRVAAPEPSIVSTVGLTPVPTPSGSGGRGSEGLPSGPSSLGKYYRSTHGHFTLQVGTRSALCPTPLSFIRWGKWVSTCPTVDETVGFRVRDIRTLEDDLVDGLREVTRDGF